jgi:Uncharacterized ACR, COG1993
VLVRPVQARGQFPAALSMSSVTPFSAAFSPKMSPANMHLPHEAMLLRIFIGESDRWKHQPLYEAIVIKARVMDYRAERDVPDAPEI